jgi:hypothetical protein
MSEIITPWGLCFMYNVALSHDLLNVNSSSSDFHYKYSLRTKNYNSATHRVIPKFPKSISTSNAGLWVGFSKSMNETNTIQNIFTGYKVILHDSYELPSTNAKIINFNYYFQSKVLVDPQINSIDEALYGYDPVE